MLSLSGKLLAAYSILCFLEALAFHAIMSLLQEMIFIQTKNQTISVSNDESLADVTKLPTFSGLTMVLVSFLSAANVIISFTSTFGNIYSRKMSAEVLFLITLLYNQRYESVPVLGTANFMSLMIFFTVYECLNGVILRAILTNLQTESKDNIMSRDAGPLYIPVNTQDYADSDDSDTEVLKTA